MPILKRDTSTLCPACNRSFLSLKGLRNHQRSAAHKVRVKTLAGIVLGLLIGGLPDASELRPKL